MKDIELKSVILSRHFWQFCRTIWVFIKLEGIMKSFIGLALFLFACNAYSADSMVIFQKPNETIVVVNETASQDKLDGLIDSFGMGDQINLVSDEGDLSLQCRRASGAKSCTFKFKTSGEVEIDGKNTYVYSNSSNSDKLRSNYLNNLEFANDKGDSFIYWLDQFQVAAEAIKQ